MPRDDVARAFNKLRADAIKAEEAADPDAEQRILAEREKELLDLEAESTVTSAEDCIPRILQSWKDNDLFRPANKHNKDAREAFERLNEAHRILKQPAKLVEEMNRHVEAARKRRALQEGQARIQERVVMIAERHKEAQGLREEEAQQVRGRVLAQAQARRREAERRRALKARARVRPDSEDEEEAVRRPVKQPSAGTDDQADSGSEDDVQRKLARIARGKKRRQ